MLLIYVLNFAAVSSYIDFAETLSFAYDIPNNPSQFEPCIALYSLGL